MVALQHTQYEQQLRRYHDKNVQQRDFNVGDLVLRRVQSPGGKLTSPVGRPLHREQCSRPRNLRAPARRWNGRGQPMEHRTPSSLLSVEEY